MLQILAGNQV